MKFKTFLFDLDGTLSDPLLGISRSINHALISLGYESHSEFELAKYIGPPLDQTFKLLTSASDNEVHALVAAYRERYRDVGFSENSLYPGIVEVLEKMSQQGAFLGLCTSKRADFAEKILRMFNLRGHFSFVSGGDIGISKKQQIAQLRKDGVIDTNALMIGDRAVDIVAAHENGLGSVGVLWGYGSRAELVDQQPLYLIEQVQQLGNLTDL